MCSICCCKSSCLPTPKVARSPHADAHANRIHILLRALAVACLTRACCPKDQAAITEFEDTAAPLARVLAKLYGTPAARRLGIWLCNSFWNTTCPMATLMAPATDLVNEKVEVAVAISSCATLVCSAIRGAWEVRANTNSGYHLENDSPRPADVSWKN